MHQFQDGLAVRRPSLDDAQRIHDLLVACDMHDFGSVDFSADETRDELSRTDLENDAWLVESDGSPVGFAGVQLRGGV
ncbi:MAG TPA: hypothetical protein VHK28_08885 [Candidatus Limnocylindria bacterium]|nr:hypothetical protein [Candidatus Limnocylindria bacterium]